MARTTLPVALAAALLLTSCGPPSLPICEMPPPPLQVWIVDYGVHTEIIVPAAQIAAPLAPLRTLFPAAHTLSFGFGKADFFTLRHPGILDFAAGAIPGPAVIRVIPLRDEPQNLYTTPIIRIPLTQPEWTRLQGFIAAAFAHTQAGIPIPAPGDDGTDGHFFAATPNYSLAYTCNAWTIDALHTASLNVEPGALLSSTAMRHVAHITAACTPG